MNPLDGPMWEIDLTDNKDIVDIMKERLQETGNEVNMKDNELEPLIGKTITTDLFNNKITMRSHFSKTKPSPEPETFPKKKQTLKNRFLSLFQRQSEINTPDSSYVKKHVTNTLKSLIQDIPDNSIYSRATRYFGSKKKHDVKHMNYYLDEKQRLTNLFQKIKNEKLLDPLNHLTIEDRALLTEFMTGLDYISKNRTFMDTERLISFLDGILRQINNSTTTISYTLNNKNKERPSLLLLRRLTDSVNSYVKIMEHIPTQNLEGGTPRRRPNRSHRRYSGTTTTKTRHGVRKGHRVRKTHRR
jgi:hypothetical protein